MSVSWKLISNTAGQDQKFQLTARAEYTATVSNRSSEYADTVLDNAPFFIGDSFNGSPLLLCTNRNAEYGQPLADGGATYRVTFDFGKFDSQDQPDNPLEQPTQYNFGTSKVEVAMDRDANGNPVVNSAGDPFLQTITTEVARMTVQLSKNLSYNSEGFMSYVGTTNSDNYLGFASNTLRIVDVGSQSQYDQNIGKYYTVTVSLEYEPRTWTRYVLDCGLRDYSTGEKADILEKGLPVSDPVPLDGDGNRLADGETPVYLQFQPYYQAPFYSLLSVFVE